MRLIKIAALAAMAAVTAMAFVGAGSASASVLKTVLCKVHQVLCTEQNLWKPAAGDKHIKIKALSTLAVLLGTLSVKCHSTAEFLVLESKTHEILLDLTLLDWSSCTGCSPVETISGLPALAHLLGTGDPLKGILDQLGPIVVLLNNCSFLHCEAKVNEASLTVNGGTIGGSANAEANEVPVELTGAFCGKSGKWDAGPGESEPYVITEVSGATSGGLYLSLESHA